MTHPNKLFLNAPIKSATEYFTPDVQKFDLMLSAYEDAISLRSRLALEYGVDDEKSDLPILNKTYAHYAIKLRQVFVKRAQVLLELIEAAQEVSEGSAKLGMNAETLEEAVLEACDAIRDRHFHFMMTLAKLDELTDA